MRQAIHIFRKDARHCWPYIAAVMALTAIHAWQASLEASNPSEPSDMSGNLLALLMVLSWWFAIGAAVHGESLVGDRQFWTTRPYSWKSILAAKLLFVAAFLALPLLLSDCIILLANGYHPPDMIPALLWRQCRLLAFFVLPFILAALTRATRELVLAGLVFYVVSCIALAAFSAHHANGSGTVYFAGPSRIADAAPWLACVAGFSLAVWQYARRRTILIRALAVALGALAPFVMLSPFGRMARSAPAPRQDDSSYRNIAVQLAADPGLGDPVQVDSHTKGLIGIPVKFSGWPRDLMTCQAMGVTVNAPGTGCAVCASSVRASMTTTADGREWIWFSIGGSKTPSSQKVDLRATVELKIFDRLIRADIWPERGWTRVPGFGIVRLAEDATGSRLTWRAPLAPGEPGWTRNVGYATTESATRVDFSVSVFNLPASPAWFPMSPVFWNSGTMSVSPPVPRPLVFTVGGLVATLHRELKVPSVRLTGDEK